MAQGNKVQSHTWSIEKLNTKDSTNATLWPFKVIRDKGRNSKMECRSLSALEESFKGTNYNAVNCPRVLSRYTLLYNALSKLNTQNITHLYVTSDFFCYKTVDDKGTSYIGVQNYAGNGVYNPGEVANLSGCALVKGKVLSKEITRVFNLSKTMPQYQKSLYDMVSDYIDKRTHMKEIDTSKGFIDVLKSDLSFTSLKYLFFGTHNNSVYLNEMISSYLSNLFGMEILSQLNKELTVYQSRLFEENRYNNYLAELRKGQGYSSIRKVFYLTKNMPNYANKSDFDKLFNDVESSTYSGLECVYISENEKKRVQKELQQRMEENKKAERVLKDAETLKEKEDKEKSELEKLSLEKYLEIIPLINIMVKMFEKSQSIFEVGRDRGTVEYKIWMKYLSNFELQKRIDAVYNYNVKCNEALEKFYPICSVLSAVAIRSNNMTDVDNIKYFNTYIAPTRYKDDRRTLQSIGIDFKMIDGLKILNKTLKEIERDTVRVFEVVMGVYYAVFGAFMQRYGIGGLSLTSNLLPKLLEEYKGKAFNITHNIKECANECFYMIYRDVLTLEGYTPELARSDAEGGIGKFADFVMLYLKELSGLKAVVELKHSGEANEDRLHYLNVIKVSEGINDILNQCLEIQNINMNSDEVLDIFVKILNESK